MCDHCGDYGDIVVCTEVHCETRHRIEPSKALVSIYLHFEPHSKVQAAVKPFFAILAADLDALVSVDARRL